jgi:hypothetical protein
VTVPETVIEVLGDMLPVVVAMVVDGSSLPELRLSMGMVYVVFADTGIGL